MHTRAHTRRRKTDAGPLLSAAGAAAIGAKITGSIKVDGRAGASMHDPADVQSQEEGSGPQRLNGAATGPPSLGRHVIKK